MVVQVNRIEEKKVIIMKSDQILLIVIISISVVITVVSALAVWVYLERKRSAKKLRELRDAIAEMSKY